MDESLSLRFEDEGSDETIDAAGMHPLFDSAAVDLAMWAVGIVIVLK